MQLRDLLDSDDTIGGRFGASDLGAFVWKGTSEWIRWRVADGAEFEGCGCVLCTGVAIPVMFKFLVEEMPLTNSYSASV